MGQSGNRLGRPVVLRSLRDLARVHTGAAIQALADVVCSTTERAAARIAAARELLDRGHGRVQVADPDERLLEELSDEELERLIEDERRRVREDAAGCGQHVRRDERECDDEDDDGA